jgi:hypothetical protein
LTSFHGRTSILNRKVPLFHSRRELGLLEIILEINKTSASGSKRGSYRVFHQPAGIYRGKAKIEAQNNTEEAKKQ